MLNVFTVLCTLYLALFVFIMVTGGVANRTKFISINFGLLGLCYVAVAVIKYIFFGKITLWHKPT